MKRRRVFLLSAIFCLIFFVFFLSSSFFKLSVVEIDFYDESNNLVSLSKNKVLNSLDCLSNMTSVANDDLGTSIFLVNKSKYFAKFELQNPYAKLLDVEAKFPNKLVFSVKERVPVFYLSNITGNIFLIDNEFKILNIAKKQDFSNLIPILISVDLTLQPSFFEFFEVSEVAFSEGQFLTENNLVLKAIDDMCNILENLYFNIQTFILSLTLSEENGQMNIILKTGQNYGVKLKVEDVLVNFNQKFEKLLKAFNTLEKREKIKTTYGTLLINTDFNCFWNKL